MAPDLDAYRIETDRAGKCMLDLLPLLARVADVSDAAFGAALFHATFARALCDWITRAAQTEQLRDVVLAGGCFLNTLLSGALVRELPARGLRVWQARQLPPNDGGLSLGQAWVARHTPVKNH
jgi:hydrogenase maturation protein HypF